MFYFFLFIIFLAQTVLKVHVYFYLFVQIHYKYWFFFSIKKTFGIFIKFGESFSLGSLLNQSQTYQGNPCGVYPNLSSFTGSGVIQIFVACIKHSTSWFTSPLFLALSSSRTHQKCIKTPYHYSPLNPP